MKNIDSLDFKSLDDETWTVTCCPKGDDGYEKRKTFSAKTFDEAVTKAKGFKVEKSNKKSSGRMLTAVGIK